MARRALYSAISRAIALPNQPLGRSAASLECSAEGHKAPRSLLSVNILNMLSPSGNAAAFPFASMLNFGEPLAIAARDCRATSSEDREDSGLQR
jgi:hypothetical protein